MKEQSVEESLTHGISANAESRNDLPLSHMTQGKVCRANKVQEGGGVVMRIWEYNNAKVYTPPPPV